MTLSSTVETPCGGPRESDGQVWKAISSMAMSKDQEVYNLLQRRAECDARRFLAQ